jgi:hypothetical protein
VSAETKRPVLFIGGAGRSGTTLLCSILGQSQDCFAAGEITHLWERGVLDDELCGCGQPFSRCDFWQEVMREAFGQLTRGEAYEIEESRKKCCGLATLPGWLFPQLPRSGLLKAFSQYEPYLVALYRSIAKVSGKAVVIDSSKFPPEALLLERSPSIDLRLAHVVRNCKAVVYAWQKKKRRPAVHWKPAYFNTYHPLVTCTAWLVFNRCFAAQIQRLGERAALIRYEDFIQDVQEAIPRLCGRLAVREPVGYCEAPDQLSASSNHMVSGNPVRFSHQPIRLKPDREWETSLNWPQRWLVDLMAGRIQREYGY